MNQKKSIEEKQAVLDGLVMKIEDVNAVIEKANYIDGGNFKARIGNTTYLVGVFFNKAKKNNRGQNEEFNLSGSDSRQFLRLYTTKTTHFLINYHSLY